MNRFAFHANCVATSHPEGFCHLVGFADEKYETQTYFMLQRDFESDEQDVELGMDTYHVEWCGQGQSGYGGIQSLSLGRTSATVVFDAQGAADLGGLEELAISFDLSAQEHAELQQALAEIFLGTDCLRCVDA